MESENCALARVRSSLLKWSVTIAMLLSARDVERDLAVEEKKKLSRKVFSVFFSFVLPSSGSLGMMVSTLSPALSS